MIKKSLSGWVGLGGIAKNDCELARQWGRRSDRLMILLVLITLPLVVFITDAAMSAHTDRLLNILEWTVLVVFGVEFFGLLILSDHRAEYVGNNWLNLLIFIVSALSLFGLMHGIWLAAARFLRVISIVSLALRGLLSTGRWFLARGIPLAIGFSLIAWVLSGLGFYFLEPTIESFGEGLWLAFVSASTVGYGDLVPTTASSRLFAIIMVLVGFGLFSMAIAAISAYFVGEDEKLDNARIHGDIVNLRSEIKQLREELHKARS
ncbi:potassium channel family protein [Burkholderiales bacterium]|nr:potassium channel family protein [Burkholderiales bacterium]